MYIFNISCCKIFEYMKEEFLHFVWKNRLFNDDLFLEKGGEKITIIDPGQYNRDSGPDFFNARVKIGETEWAGNVEIHIRSSSWYSHGHHNDHAYDNVILHVVSDFDKDIYTASGSEVYTTVIRYDQVVYERYREYMTRPGIIICRDELPSLDSFTIRHWIHNLAVSRLEQKTERIRPQLNDTCNDWEETLYRSLAGYFGMSVNTLPFTWLASSLPLKLLVRHSDDLNSVEALMYGQAGFLSPALFRETPDDYYFLLTREYTALRKKYDLKPMDGWIWKLGRMRPANFPTIRISQFASLITKTNPLFSRIKETDSIDDLRTLLRSESSGYWSDHYLFGRKSKSSVKSTGSQFIDLLILNAVIPLLFLYGKENSLQKFCDKAIDFADAIPAEKNRITKEWAELGIEPVTAFESQGLIELRSVYCKNRMCLNCHIGTKLISLGKELDHDNAYFLEDPR